MSDENNTRPVKVHRVVLMVVDRDDLGAEGVSQVLEATKYPNWCIAPRVREVQTRTVDFHDQHPLNLRESSAAAFRALFADEGGDR